MTHKRFALFALAAIAAVLTASSGRTQAAIAHWSFDTPTITVGAAGITAATDQTGNHNASTVYAGTGGTGAGPQINSVAGQFGQAAEFNYVKYDDGKMIYFIDGLANRILQERILDVHDNVSRRDTVNMKYNTKRLMTDYDARTVDSLGNVSTTEWRNAQYSNDSVYYAGEYTNANKHMISYVQENVDLHGNTTGVTWTDGELWHATWEGDQSELRRVDPRTGEVLERLDMPAAAFVSGLESNGSELFYCGSGNGGTVRAVRRPKRRSAKGKG